MISVVVFRIKKGIVILRSLLTRTLPLIFFVNYSLADAAPKGVGFTRIPLSGGRSAAIWYPSSESGRQFQYTASISGKVALNGKAASGKYPIVLFSHGLGGCSLQSIFLTESWARKGYVVAAPDHKDALCNANGGGQFPSGSTEPSLLDPGSWTSATYSDRASDLKLLLKLLSSNRRVKSIVDKTRVVAAGHSLGGYTAYGVAGGWPSLKIKEVKGLLLLSPYLYPWLLQNSFGRISSAVHFEGGGLDFGITPSLSGLTGAYARSKNPREFLYLNTANHFSWTDLLCVGEKTISGCVNNGEARLMIKYTTGFLNAVLRRSTPLKRASNGTGTFVNRW